MCYKLTKTLLALLVKHDASSTWLGLDILWWKYGNDVYPIPTSVSILTFIVFIFLKTFSLYKF